MKDIWIPFICVGGLVFAMGNGMGDPLALPAANTGTQSTGHSQSAQTEDYPNAYDNGLIGQMIYDMRYDGKLSPQTEQAANAHLIDCVAIQFNHPSCQ